MTLLLDSAEAARRLRLAPATLAKLRMAGTGPRFIKVGARVLYPEAEIATWVDAQPRRVSTTDEPDASVARAS